jgi:hypothetical protein
LNISLVDHAKDTAFAEEQRCRVQQRRDRQRNSHLNNLLGALCSIAKGLGLHDPKIEAERIKQRLLRHVAQHEAALVRDLRHHARIEPWRRKAQRPNERWACHLVRLKSNRRKIGLKCGTQRLNWKEANKQAIKHAAAVKPEELNPVERRAVELLMGRKQKSRKNLIEKRALDLVKSIKREWFQSKRKLKIQAEHDVDRPILSITDVISIAAPIIEDFAQEPIAFRKHGSNVIPPSFEALYSTVCAYARDGDSSKKSTVNRLLRWVRDKRVDVEKVQVHIAPALRGWME